MKFLMVAITLLSGTMLAQSGLQLGPQSGQKLNIPPGSSPAYTPSYSQLYCAGFVTRRAIPRTNFILGSKESPLADTFPGHSELFLGGPGLAEGERYSILRQIADPNRETSSPEQRNRFEKLGALYEEVGWVTVRSVKKGVTTASFDFSCDGALRGDIVVPYQEKLPIAFRPVDDPIDPFREPSGVVQGHVLGSRDFAGLLGTGQIVYTDFGSAKGAKAGDYLLILRGYASSDLNKIDRISEALPRGAENDFSTVDPAHIKADADSRIPRHVLGEMLVLNATPESSTAIITRSFAEMQLGDVIEGEDGQPVSAVAAKHAHEPSSCRLVSRLHQLVLLHPHACRNSKVVPAPAP
jgi:hypothetical protein